MRIFIDYMLRMMIISAAAAGLLAYVYNGTAERIAANIKTEKILKMKRILPAADEFKEYETSAGNYTQGFALGSVIGTVMETAAQGYGGEIKLLAGINPEGSVIGIQVVSHKETPGLGKNIEQEWFKDQFKNTTLHNLSLKKDDPSGSIDAITAATISSRAVTKAVREAVGRYGDITQ